MQIYNDIVQGTDEWLQLRLGILTASALHLLLTPTLKTADNDRSRSYIWELAAQRITGHVAPSYVTADMERGHIDEELARAVYREHYAPVEQVGFITEDKYGPTLGYSPDGLVGDDGLIEVKSRVQKYQLQTALSHNVPSEYMIQLQAGMLISGRKWCDFISYSGGMHMIVRRVCRDERTCEAIIGAATAAELTIQALVAEYGDKVESEGWQPTPRTDLEIRL